VHMHTHTHGWRRSPRVIEIKGNANDCEPIDKNLVEFYPLISLRVPRVVQMGSGDGGIRLHSLGHEEPLESWPGEREGLAESRALRAVRWSLSRPAVFFVLDGAGQVRSWDLLKSRGGALGVEKPTRCGRVVAMAAFGDPEKPGLPSGLVLAKEGGAVEVHQLSSKLSTPDEDEVSRLETLLHQ
uniref:Uncharacterized protein n=1 Tax=Petromyzon marinus TaxID=7757 RepID=S4RI73_PETMA